MTESLNSLASHGQQIFGEKIVTISEASGELTIVVEPEHLTDVCQLLRDDPRFACDQLIDLCGVDYLDYGKEGVSGSWQGQRFAVVYHLLSVKNNHRIRLRVFAEEELPVVDSVVDIWASADWYEREAFDLFGIIFEGHPDLRRILTDYGFIGHPFRKDFPLIGNVEMRYDPEKGRVVYEPVSIEPRVLVPRVIREEGYGGRDT
jgi:NADH-quinone oxidoreductase subunit C